MHLLKLDPESILKFLKDSYYSLKKDLLWEPANRPGDTGVVPSTLMANLNDSSAGAWTKALKALLQLDKSAVAGDGSKEGKKTPQNSPCKLCGKLGHWSPNCPDKGKLSSGSKSSNSGSNNTSSARSWKRQPPGPSDPQMKKVNRTNFFWCAKCNRWSTSHGTDQHQKKERSDAPVPSASLAIDPSVWIAANTMDPNHDLSFDQASTNLQHPFLFVLGTLVIVVSLLKAVDITYSSKLLFALIGSFHSVFCLSKKLVVELVMSKATLTVSSFSSVFSDFCGAISALGQLGASIMNLLSSVLDVGYAICLQTGLCLLLLSFGLPFLLCFS